MTHTTMCFWAGPSQDPPLPPLTHRRDKRLRAFPHRLTRDAHILSKGLKRTLPKKTKTKTWGYEGSELCTNCRLGTGGHWHHVWDGEVALLSPGGVSARQKGRAHTCDNFPTGVGLCVPMQTCFNTPQLKPGLALKEGPKA